MAFHVEAALDESEGADDVGGIVSAVDRVGIRSNLGRFRNARQALPMIGKKVEPGKLGELLGGEKIQS